MGGGRRGEGKVAPKSRHNITFSEWMKNIFGNFIIVLSVLCESVQPGVGSFKCKFDYFRLLEGRSCIISSHLTSGRSAVLFIVQFQPRPAV